jgi:chromosome partitioning protein
MLIISVVHQKGGVGKTTLALNLAFCLSETLKVGITDTDIQGSISEIEEFITGIDLVPLEKVRNNEQLDYDVLVIDTPPYLTNKLHEIFLVSDFVLIPTKAGYLDALAVRATIGLYKEAKKQKNSLKAGIVLNMVMHNTNLNSEVKEILEGYDLPLLKTQISHRVSFTRSPMTNGIFNSEDERAKAEIVNLADEILTHLQS